MALFSRFFGKQDDASPEMGMVANPAIKDPVCLQVLFAAEKLPVTAEAIQKALRAYDPSLQEARCEIEFSGDEMLGLIGWGQHVIRLVGFNAPFPAASVEQCVAPAHYPDPIKQEVRNSASHLLLYYGGYVGDVFEQYLALAVAAGAIASFGATGVLNETAHCSLPAALLNDDEVRGQACAMLGSLPLLALFCGFVKYEVDGTHGVWMRTYGAEAFGLPNFATLAAGHHEGEAFFDLFGSILDYLRTSNAVMEAGHTMQVGENTFMKVRNATQSEYFLHDKTPVLVAEMIEASEVNTPQ